MKIHHFETNINDEYHFKEIDKHMEEFWKTHIAVSPHEDDPPYIVARIKENLTMDKNSITITIDNYCGQRITFTMSEDAKIESLFELDTNSIKITHVSINAYDDDILVEKEDLT